MHHKIFIQQIVFPLDGTDGKVFLPDELMYLSRVHTGGVDNEPAAEHAPGSGDGEALRLPRDGRDTAAPVERRAVPDGRLRHSQCVLPGVHDGGGGGQQGLRDGLAQRRFHRPGLVPGQEAQLRNAVFPSPLQKRPEAGPVLLAEGQDHAAVLPVGHVQFAADGLRHGTALRVQPGHERPRFGVVSGVDDGTVGLGGPRRHVVSRLQDGHAQAVAAQMVGAGRADHPAADNDHILHFASPFIALLFLLSPAAGQEV